MTARPDPANVVHAFLLEGPDELSVRSIEAIRGNVHRTQQRAMRPWRFPSMPRPILLFAALAGLLAAAGAMLLVSSGSPSTGPAPSASGAPGGGLATSSAVTTSSATPDASPTTTPYPLADGEAWITYVGDGRLRLIRPDGTGLHALLPERDCDTCDPAWSPDGRQIAVSYNDGEGAELWVVNADGSDFHAVKTSGDECLTLLCTEAIQPAWSPDGASIAYIAPQHNGGTFVQYSLMRLDLASGVATELYTTTEGTIVWPTWSPDSGSIAFETRTHEFSPEASAISETGVAVLDLTAGDATPVIITEGTRLAGYPTWHPTDDLIVFRTNPLTDESIAFTDPTIPSDLFTVRPDGSEVTRITTNPAGGPVLRAPSWTPDGRILHSRLATIGADEELRIMDVDGSGDASATGPVVTLGEGRWRPGT